MANEITEARQCAEKCAREHNMPGARFHLMQAKTAEHQYEVTLKQITNITALRVQIETARNNIALLEHLVEGNTMLQQLNNNTVDIDDLMESLESEIYTTNEHSNILSRTIQQEPEVDDVFIELPTVPASKKQIQSRGKIGVKE